MLKDETFDGKLDAQQVSLLYHALFGFLQLSCSNLQNFRLSSILNSVEWIGQFTF